MSGNAPPPTSTGNPEQHAPLGELPPGCHSTYYTSGAERDNARLELYKHFLRPGELVFDIGANIGEFTTSFLALGCRVVAVEPQPQIARRIDPRATVVVAACGAQAGTATFYEVGNANMVSTMREDIAARLPSANAAWTSRARPVEVVTLDGLIAEYGEPAFAKIDVEGFEVEVLRGLSTPLRAMSLELHNFDEAKTGQVLAELARLGDYGLMYAAGDSFKLQSWPVRELAWYGDLYATLRT